MADGVYTTSIMKLLKNDLVINDTKSREHRCKLLPAFNLFKVIVIISFGDIF